MPATKRQPSCGETRRNDDANVAADARCVDVKMHSGRWQIQKSDWPIEGRSSAFRVTRYLADSGRGGPESYHKWWRVTAKLGLHVWE